jgi:hypothetical protein
MIAQFPRSQAYLIGAGVRPAELTALPDYWAAVILAECAFTDEELMEAGTVDFGSGPIAGRDGTAILGALDTLLRTRQPRRKTKPTGISGADMESLKAFFGSRGIKAGKLVTDAHFWTVATTLWPAHVKRVEGHLLVDLLRQIKGMSKKQRQSGRAHVASVPAHFIARAA